MNERTDQGKPGPRQTVPQRSPSSQRQDVPAREAGPEPENPGISAALRPPWYRRRAVVLALGLVLIAGAVFLASYLLDARAHESTDDAFLDAHVAQVAPKIAGRVTAVHVDDNQHVERGALLVEIDPRDQQSIVEQRTAAVQNVVAAETAARTSTEQAEAHLVTLRADVAAAKAGIDAAAADARRAEDDFQRAQKLAGSGAISKQELVHAKTAAAAAAATLDAARRKLAAAEAQLTEGNAAVTAAQAQAKAAKAQTEQARAAESAAKLELSYAKVTAPESGRIANRSVEIGSYVQAGQSLMAIVPNELWVTANFKETQLRLMRPGQSATVEIDAYPGREFRAHIDSVQRGSGAQFSLLPPENATGNYVKVVQRVPVKLVFDEPLPAEKPLGPGMSVVPTIAVRTIRNRGLILVLTGLGTAVLVAFLGRLLVR